MEQRDEPIESIESERLWQKNGWIAKVIKNEDDDGWAVEMTRCGDPEPALVGPWTMGRDKKNPKPLNAKDFATLVKTASEVLERHVQHARSLVHKSVTLLDEQGRRVRVDLDLSADEEDPRSTVTCSDDATGERLSEGRVPPAFKLTIASATDLIRASPLTGASASLRRAASSSRSSPAPAGSRPNKSTLPSG
jgi:hypothetical protein